MLKLVCAFVLAASCAHAAYLNLSNEHATCTIDTHGARIVSYCVNGREYLWMPPAPDPDAAQALWLHGGIPLAWPWFGRLGEGDNHIHGFAWKCPFTVTQHTPNSATLTLPSESATLTYTITLDAALTLHLCTTNRTAHDFPLGVAFHPYFRVGERDAATLSGVWTACTPLTNTLDNAVKFDRIEDGRVYTLHDSVRKCTLRIAADGSTGVNVWNPGAEKNCPGLIPGDEWRRFVAVEPFTMGGNRFHVLKPHATHTLSMTLSVSDP